MLDEEEERIFLVNRIREIMAEKNMTLYGLSKESLIPQPTFRRWFKGTAMPTLGSLVQLCNGLGITLSELFTKDDKAER